MGVLSTLGAASARAFGLTRLSAIAAAVDAFFNRTTLLLHGDGTNGAQNNTFLDSSSNNFTITRNGNTTQGTFTPFSQTGWSNYFSGTGSYLSAADNAAFELGSGTFTIEAWVYLTGYSPSYSGSYSSCVIAKDSSTDQGFFLNIEGTASSYTGLRLRLFSNNSTFTDTVGTFSFSLNTWYHVAAVRSGTGTNQTLIFVNGVLVGSGTNAITVQNTAVALTVGAMSYSGFEYYFQGYLSNVRFTLGGALYTGAFTPSTVPLTTTVSSGTVSLLTCQSNRFIDNSSNNFALTLTGTPSVQAFSPFAPTAAYGAATVGGSGYFDGAGDYLQIAHNAALTVTGNVDACFEAWIYPTSVGASGAYILNKSGISGTSYPNYGFYLNASRNLTFLGGNSGSPGSAQITLSGSSVIPLNAWTHVVATKRYVGGATVNEYRVFVNGKLDGYASQANISDARAGVFTVGFELSGSMAFTGNIVGTRVFNTSIPVAYQTTSTTTGTQIFTPPSSPATSGTESVLLNFTNAGIFDQTGKCVLETVGNAQISTTVKKYGTGSLAFDGTGDYLYVPSHPNFGFGTGDYTVEFWIYVNSLPSGGAKYTVIDFRPTNTGTPHTIYLNSSGYFGFYNGSSDVTSSSQPISAGSWYYVAYSRTSGTLRIYVSGSQAYSAANTIDYQSSRALWLGSASGGTSEFFNGYIDDLRITKGYGRGYTGSTITVPTAAFPDQ